MLAIDIAIVDPSGDTDGHSPANSTSPTPATSGTWPAPLLIISMSALERGFADKKKRPVPSGFHAGSRPLSSPDVYSTFPGFPAARPSSDITSTWPGMFHELATS